MGYEIMKTTVLFATSLILSATAAFAQGKPTPPSVPEIDALAGIAALAVVGAAIALIRERSK